MKLIILKAILILIGTHLIGSAVLLGFISGPSYILAAPIFGIFGFFLIPFEAVGLFLMWTIYKPVYGQSISKTFLYGLLFGIIGALIAAQIIPKEVNNELIFWIGGFFAGLCAASFSFICIHRIKIQKITKTEPIA